MDTFFKGKKIAAYIALKHHTRFIIPVMEKLKAYGADTIYIVGAAERSQEVTAIETQIPYKHVFEYTQPGDQEEVHATYLTLRDGFIRGIKKDIAIGSSALLTVMDKNLQSTAREYIGFRNFLDIEKPDLCFALHEMNRWGKMLSFWSKKKNIPFISLQEGLTNAADYIFIGHVQFSTANLVWGEKTREKLIGFEAPSDKVYPVGNTLIAEEVKLLKKRKVRKTKRKQLGLKDRFTMLLLFSATPSPVPELMPLFELFEQRKDLKLIVKFHPVTTQPIIEAWRRAIPEKIKKQIRLIHGEESTYDLMETSDLCVQSEPSTTGLEALAIGKPLVQLKLETPDQYPYDFVNAGVAMHLTPTELREHLEAKFDFHSPATREAIKEFIKAELTDTDGARDRIIQIMQSAITHNQDTLRPEFQFATPDAEEALKWSMVLNIPRDPQHFLHQLERISVYSEGEGDYEVILVNTHPDVQGLKDILTSLEGDVTVIERPEETELAQALNAGAAQSKGRHLIFLGPEIAPNPDWLSHLSRAMEAGDTPRIFGGMVISPNQNIRHAGMNVDANNAPAPAYLHLDHKFPKALKPRPFQMVDHFICLDRDMFKSLGGFHPQSGDYAFMDICLAAQETETPSPVFYIPEVQLTAMTEIQHRKNSNASLYFYSRWQSRLWDNESQFYKNDNITQLQLDAARMTRAMEIIKG